MMQHDERSTKGEWIEWIKAKEIADSRPQPDGTILYRRQPTVRDLVPFLRQHFHDSGLTDQDIKNAIAMAMARARPQQPALSAKPEDKSQKQIPGQQPPKLGAPPPPAPPPGPARLGGPPSPPPRPPSRKPPGFDKNKATDVKFRDIKEATKNFIYEPGAELSEPVIADIFMLLIGRIREIEQEKQKSQGQQATKQNDLEKLKSLIDNKLTPEEREYLYRILKPTISEEEMPISSISDMLRSISQKTAYVKGIAKVIDYNELKQAWEADNRPTDSEKLKKFLKNKGYQEQVIDQIFDGLGTSDSEQTNNKEQILIQIAEYIKQNNLTAEAISYLEQKLSEVPQAQPTGIKSRIGKMFKRFTNEEVKNILETISQFPVDRHYIRQLDQERTLGRSMK
jgi:hypothetical protein